MMTKKTPPTKQFIQLKSLLTSGHLAEATRQAEALQEEYPHHLELMWILAKLYQESNDLPQLQKQLELINEQFPNEVQALVQLANLNFRLKNNKEALSYINKAEHLAPEDVQVLNHKSLILNETFQYNEAIEALEKIVSLGKASVYVWNNLGMTYQSLGMFDLAEQHYLKAIELAGNKDDSSYNNLILLNHYIPSSSQKKIFNLSTRWERKYAKKIKKVNLIKTEKTANKILRIGLFSDGFRIHPVGQMITQILELLPSHEIELFAYSTNLKDDPITQRIKKCVAHWVTVDHLNEQQFAELLAEDNLDILFDLSGHMSGSRLKTVVMKPAPIIIKWVGGLVNTTGISTVDYLLSDAIESPVGVDEWYTEKLIRMPHDYVCYEAPGYSHDVYSPPALHNGYITLGCFNNPQKINNIVLEKWAEIMHQLPNSRLFLKSFQFNSSILVENVTKEMESLGITKERLIIEGPSSHSELLKAYNKVDIALDPWPYSGGLTTCEAMFMGVPVVTYPGPTFAGRHSASHLTNAGLGQLVVDSWEEYVSLVLDLASDTENLANIRQHLRNALLESPVCDAHSFARHFSNAMRAIWQRHCEGLPPAALTLDATGQCQFSDNTTPIELQLPTEPEQVSADSNDEQSFSFNFTGLITALDHGATLASRPYFRDFLKKGGVNYICLDPGGVVRNAQQLQHTGLFHHFPLMVLGDGSKMDLRLAVQAELSSTLPLSAAADSSTNQTALVSTTAVTSNRIDDINGIDNIDWLVLDAQHHNLSILQHGQHQIADALLIDVGVCFLPEHSEQVDFGVLNQVLVNAGFKLLKLNKLPLSESHEEKNEASYGQAVFIPDSSRLRQLNSNRLNKLAFLLDSIYSLKGAAYQQLKNAEHPLADNYLAGLSLEEKKQAGLLSPPPAPLEKTAANNHLLNTEQPSIDMTDVKTLKAGRYTREHSRICVGVPIYNEAAHIVETLSSLKNQTLDDVHFLIIDNVSTDNSVELCLEVIGDDERFTLLQQYENRGAMPNFQAAFDLSQSEYFMWLGGHDFISKNYLASAVTALEDAPQIAMVLGQPHAVFNGQHHGLMKEALYNFSDSNSLNRYLHSVAQLSNCTIFHSLFRRQALQGHKLRKTISADHVLISHLLWQGQLHYIEGAQYHRRFFEQRSSSQSERISGNKEYLSRHDFFCFYLDDFALLYEGDSRMQRYLEGKMLNILEQRFGVQGLMLDDARHQY